MRIPGIAAAAALHKFGQRVTAAEPDKTDPLDSEQSLMPRRAKCIGLKGGYREGHVSDGLRGVHNKIEPVLAAECADFFEWSERAVNIGNMVADEHVGIGTKQTLEAGADVTAGREDIKIGDFISCKAADRPIDSIVFPVADQDVRTGAYPRFDGQIECMGSIEGKNDMRRILGTDELTQITACIVDHLGRAEGKTVRGTAWVAAAVTQCA